MRDIKAVQFEASNMTLGKGNIVTGLVIVVIGGVTILGGVAAQSTGQVGEGEYLEVFVTGDGVVSEQGDVVYLWQSEPHTVISSLTPSESGAHYIHCLDSNGAEYDCQQGTLETDEGFHFDFAGGYYSTGRHQIRVRLHEDNLGFDNPKVEELTFTIRIIEKRGDIDDDGLSNQAEVDEGTELRNSDTDSDGLSDGAEVNEHRTDPLRADTDGDGLDDGAEVDRYRTDPNTVDTDSDNLDDGREVNELGTDPTSPHSDGDGLQDGAEVNQYDTNPTRTDSDGDGIDDGEEVERGSDPNSADSSDDSSSSSETTEPDRSQSTEATTNSRTDGSSQETEFERGFFTNNRNSSLSVLDDPFNVTTVGFLLSIVGILLELRGGQ